MIEYEYKIIDAKDIPSTGMFKSPKREDIENHLTSLGSEGWEIINVSFRELAGEFGFTGIAKREVR